MMLFKVAFLESDGRVNNELGFVAFAFKKPDNAVTCTDAFNDMLQHAVEQFLCRKSLRAGGGQKSQTAKFCVELFVSRAGAFQHDDDHGDTERHAEKIVESNA